MANGRCRMHGGTNPGAPMGNQYAVKDGLYTREAIEKRKSLRQFLQDCDSLLAGL